MSLLWGFVGADAWGRLRQCRLPADANLLRQEASAGGQASAGIEEMPTFTCNLRLSTGGRFSLVVAVGRFDALILRCCDKKQELFEQIKAVQVTRRR